MFYQYSGRNQRPRGLKVNQAFQVALVLAVCIWLFYQIIYSQDKREEYDGSVKENLSSDHKRIILGSKGNSGPSSDGVQIDSGDGNPTGEDEKKDGGGGDDELDENDEEESPHKRNEGSQESITNHDKKGDQENPEAQYKDPQDIEDNVSDTQVRDGDEGVGSGKENDEDGDSKESAEEVAPHGINGFHDENGVPENGHELRNANESPSPIAEGFGNEENNIEMPTENMVVEREAFRSQTTSKNDEMETLSNSTAEGRESHPTAEGENHNVLFEHEFSTLDVRGPSNNTQDAGVVSED
ncbi:PREDICTED: uncharacterized protein DDB_G0290685-like [Nelumbo nucifera]|uniref:Uncharacterized protein DDB_G0290685-like n=2 Tax=Nelumbo nucifera TaxID=4432 RepID=A0A1U8AWJ9_NELNU|nr:PREDICTED: uncharacterized protein DDB_G0290685-like [Nelumbo nucifera]DAD48857.1 TPA_asm: hypothetical protein HUJ06_018794 [Nelumbo nucifera]